MKIHENIPLSTYTTFHIGGPARYFSEIKSENDFKEALEFAKGNNLETLILSGGSNMLVSDNGFQGLVLYMNNKGFEVLEEDHNSVTAKVASGETWDEAVERVVSSGWWGIENLSLIPGKAGAAAVQNIGAYGQEVGDVITSAEVYDLDSQEFKVLSHAECKFSYRKSVFNTESKGRYVVLSITFKFKKNADPLVEYPDIKKYFADHGVKKPSLQQMREAIVSIRKNKLPDPKDIGNSGSFFKNLILNNEEYEILRNNVEKKFDQKTLEKLEGIKNKFPHDEGIKIPTALLIDICGFKGSSEGGAKISEKQALVILNETGKATSDDVMSLAKKIRQTVHDKTGMKLDIEPELIGFSGEELNKYLSLGSN